MKKGAPWDHDAPLSGNLGLSGENVVTQKQVHVNIQDIRNFLEGFDGKHYITLIHAAYDMNSQTPTVLRPRTYYGTTDDILHKLNEIWALNCGKTENHQFNVYYCVNDPGQGEHAKKGCFSSIRVIYQDCDNPEFSDVEPEIDGQQSHITIETSPGKCQRIWHTEPLPVHLAGAIHDHMVARTHHDKSTKGEYRILRMPGFRNWKYEGGPTSYITGISDAPRLTLERVKKHFGFRDNVAGNANAVMNTAQSSGELPDTNIVQLDRERTKRTGVSDSEIDDRRRQRDADATATNQIKTESLLAMLSLIDPDGHRDEWRKTLGILHFMAGEREWGRDLAEIWSSQGALKWDASVFEREWGQFRHDGPHLATYHTLRRMTKNRRHDTRTRALLACPGFQRIREQYGDVLEFESLLPDYPKTVHIETGGTTVMRPDPKARVNVEYLLQMEGARVYWDALKQSIMMEQLGRSFEFDNNHLMSLYSTAHFTDFRVDDSWLLKQVHSLSLDDRHDPVLDYINRLPPWDGVERLNTVFQRHLGAPDTPSVRECFALMMAAIIRRTYQPGYKFDIMPILEGKQHLGKSSFMRLIMPFEEWYTDGPRLNEEAKRLLGMLEGKVVIEFAELVGMSPQNIEAIKKLVSSQYDEYIPNHAKRKVRHPRRCIMYGTTNKKRYLRDLTGNRRFPIIETTKYVNFVDLIAEREQLWAEALFMDDFIGERLEFSKTAMADMEEIQKERVDVNTEVNDIVAKINRYSQGWVTKEDIWSALGFPHQERYRRTGHAQHVFKEVIELLEANNWKYTVLKYEGKSIRALERKRNRGSTTRICYAPDKQTFVRESDKFDPESILE